MTRISIHGKGQALDGDRTTTGAVCIASSTQYRANNQRALRLGDVTTECPNCKKPGVIVQSCLRYRHFWRGCLRQFERS